MPDSTIAALTADTALDGAEEWYVNDAGADKKITPALLASYLGNSVRNRSIADQTPAAATLTYITGSDLAVPTGLLRVGTQFRWKLDVSKTAAGVAARTFHIRVGTLGTTADAAILTFLSTSAPTAAADVGIIEITATIRAIGAAAGVMLGILELRHNGNTVGFASIPVHMIAPAASATFNTTTAGLKVGLTVTTGAAEVITIRQVIAEAFNL